MTELDNEFSSVENSDELSSQDAEAGSAEPLAGSSEVTEPTALIEEPAAGITEPEPEQDVETTTKEDAVSEIEDVSDADEPEEPKKESRVRRFFRLLVRWTLGLLIVFGIGFLTAVYLLYRPEVESNRDLHNQLQTEQQVAGEQVAELESQIGLLESQIESLQPLATENEQLLAVQDEFELHISILDARVDVANALLALATDDSARARVALERTGETLAKISSLLPDDQREIVSSMDQRLELALDGMEDASYVAQSDLDVLTKLLLELEDSLFGTP